MKGCKLCEMLEYQQQQQQKLLLKSGSLTSTASKLPTTSSRHLLNYCNHLASIRRSSTGSSGSACESNGSPSMSSASSSSSLISVPSPTTSLPSPVAVAAAAAAASASTMGAHLTGSSTLGVPVPTSPSSSSLAANLEQSYHAILPPHFRDMFYATHLLRGKQISASNKCCYYQPAGPLISQHVLPPVPPTSSSLVASSKQISSPLDPERDHQLSQISHQSSSSTENPDSDVLITGGDLSPFRYPSQQSQQGQPPQAQALSALASSQQPSPQQNSPYSRQIHPMHYPPYPPSYYNPYGGDAMCYPPPYQHYFPKVYQSAPTYRRYTSYYQPGPPPPPNDLYDPPPPPSNAAQPPPPSGSQLVPAGHSGPQHIEHYPGPPGFYTGYNPGGGECYPPRGMQPPYMEYPAPCPCPMQSCPKNVLTGPLIGSNSSNSGSNNNNLNSSTNSNSANTMNSGSTNINSISNNNSSTTNNNSSLNNHNQPLKANKGPVRIPSNHLIGQHDQAVPPPSTNLANGQPMLGKPMHRHHHHLTCKMELMDPLKTEMKSNVISNSTETRKTGQYEENVVPPTPPTMYTVNDKLTEPEATLSPARGSTGPQTVPEQNEDAAAQTKGNESSNPTKSSQCLSAECENTNSNSAPLIGRKARIGKSMAREMMYGAHTVNTPHQHTQICTSHPFPHHHQHPLLPSHNSTSDAAKVPAPESMNVSITPNINKIKKEEIKLEEEDDVVILEEEVKEVKSEPDVVEIPDKSSDVEDNREDISVPRLHAKRIKILDNKSSGKKSSPNGYKSLIKQAEPKSYLCLSAMKRDKKSYFRKYSRLASRSGIRKRKLVLTEQQKKRLSIRKRNLIMMEKMKQQKMENAASTVAKKSTPSLRVEVVKQQENNTSHRLEFEKPELPAEYMNENRGYFSEPDIRSTSSRKTKKTRSTETRSKSETKKSKSHRKVTNHSTSASVMNGNLSSDETMPKLPENINNSNNSIISQTERAANEQRTSKKSSHSKNSKKKSKSQQSSNEEEGNDCNNQTTTDFPPRPVDASSSAPATSRMDVDERVTDDSLSEQNNNNKAVDFPEDIPAATVTHFRTTHSGKRSRARGSRFSKKRSKYRRLQEVDDSIIPRKLNAVPKWNNGWSWLGEPFQAKVFLNSDDPLVIRTCYPSMQHTEGDIIRPRDCVLLKAGNKKNELPYVAKVAHLWENPEDGEMMMSLLWYYRPEHTEQGRQPNDCSDEVFASRHRDHNSVACIEDKCYVLTFSEYCRHRRRVRGAEEGIEEEHSVVPLLKTSSNIPKVPVTTNPEQVMFCQRVYEFRMKRLLKTPTN
ncbi:unnamed protein product [Hermetia illucens]|uniref:BAH domain-containing protein n=1 Tax=Hermetia illucens TaxID=343691 RepID=A0A7R8UVK9_HERIL|nr:unnamed protein product [Hermetia illucens]